MQWMLWGRSTRGIGVRHNFRLAASCYRKAAKQGNFNAQFNLALCYADGHGVPTNYPQAIRWLQKPIRKGMPEAVYMLGRFYRFGQGVKKDARKGSDYFPEPPSTATRTPCVFGWILFEPR
jgi:TPR repeat protein